MLYRSLCFLAPISPIAKGRNPALTLYLFYQANCVGGNSFAASRKPSPSSVVAFTLTASAGTPQAAMSFSHMAGRCKAPVLGLRQYRRIDIANGKPLPGKQRHHFAQQQQTIRVTIGRVGIRKPCSDISNAAALSSVHHRMRKHYPRQNGPAAPFSQGNRNAAKDQRLRPGTRRCTSYPCPIRIFFPPCTKNGFRHDNIVPVVIFRLVASPSHQMHRNSRLLR